MLGVDIIHKDYILLLDNINKQLEINILKIIPKIFFKIPKNKFNEKRCKTPTQKTKKNMSRI